MGLYLEKNMSLKIAVMPGDGIGVEIIAEAVKVLEHYKSNGRLDAELTNAPVGGAGYDAAGKPLPDETLALAKARSEERRVGKECRL